MLVQHELPAAAPVFAVGSATHHNHPAIAHHEASAAKRIGKQFSSVFASTDLEAWLREQEVDTITLVGYMTNNCVLASAADAEPRGFAVEVLSDATGATDLANQGGNVSARQVQETLMALLHSNWAAVAETAIWTAIWTAALLSGDPLHKGDLVTSAAQGRTSA